MNLKQLIFGIMAIIVSITGANAQTLLIGVNAEITGEIPSVGASCVNAAQMAVDDINQNGGITIDGTNYTIDLVIRDNEDDTTRVTEITEEFIELGNSTTPQLIAMVGPNTSRNAISASEIAEAGELLMITPWSTNVATTQDKEWVLRTPFTDDFQGVIIAEFILGQLGSSHTAVLFDEGNPYSNGIANIFKEQYELLGGSITAFEGYPSGVEDFTSQIQAIIDSEVDVLFLPNYFYDVPIQVEQVRNAGFQGIIVGSDSWAGSAELFSLGTELMEGAYLSAHFTPNIDTSAAVEFVSRYQDAYGSTPDDVAALTYDTFNVLFAAIQRANSTDSAQIKAAYSQLGVLEGVTGKMQYMTDSGTPIKNAVILQIKNGEFEYFTSAGPLVESSYSIFGQYR